MCSKRAKEGLESGTAIACLADPSRRKIRVHLCHPRLSSCFLSASLRLYVEFPVYAMETEAPPRSRTDPFWPSRVKVNQSKSNHPAGFPWAARTVAVRPCPSVSVRVNPRRSSVKVNQSKSNLLIRRAPSGLVLGIWFFSGAWILDAWSFTLPATRHPSPLTGLWTVDCGLRTAHPSTPDPRPSSGPCTIVTIVTIISNFLTIPNISIIAMIATVLIFSAPPPRPNQTKSNLINVLFLHPTRANPRSRIRLDKKETTDNEQLTTDQ